MRRREGVADRWVPVFEALNLPLVGEMTVDTQWAQVATYLHEGALAVPGVPIAAERWQARRLLQARELAEREGQRLAAIERAREEWAQEQVRRQEEARAREKAAAAALKKAALARDAAARLKNASRLAAAAAGSSSAQGPAKPPAPWGTPEAKRREIERIRREIEAKREGQHDERDESN